MEILRYCIKKQTADLWSAPAGNESVVISYGIVTANDTTFLNFVKMKMKNITKKKVSFQEETYLKP